MREWRGSPDRWRGRVGQRRSRTPAQCRQGTAVERLARHPIRACAVEFQSADEADDVTYLLRKLGDRQIHTASEVDGSLIVVVTHDEQAGVGEVIGEQELAAWRARTPDRDSVVPRFFRLVHAPEQRADHVRIFRVVVIAQPKSVGGDADDEVVAMLTPIGVAQLDAGEFGSGVGGIRRLEGSRHQLLDGHRLRQSRG